MDLFWQVAHWQQNKTEQSAGSPSKPAVKRAYKSDVGGGYARLLALAGLLLIGLLMVLPAFASRNLVQDLIFIFYMLALAQYWNLLAGYAGLVSVGQQAFAGLGAYILFTLTIFADIDPILAALRDASERLRVGRVAREGARANRTREAEARCRCRSSRHFFFDC